MGQEIFGDYTLKQLLASGEAADVWLASKGDSEVIIKRILAPWSQNPQLRKIFLEIVKDVVPLRHANLVAMLDFGQEGEFLYVVFEKVDGIFLAQILRAQQPLARKQVLTLAAGLLSGLSFLHQSVNPFTGGKIVHSEVSPANVLVDTLGRPRIVDMGFTRTILEAGLPGKPAIPDQKYLAPEVLAGAKTDSSADVYGAGMIFNDLAALLESDSMPSFDVIRNKASAANNRYHDASAMLKDLTPLLETNNISIADAILDDFSDWSAAIEKALAKNLPTSSYMAALKKRYQIISELGRGAMGIVLHARDKTLDEQLAIKILNSDKFSGNLDLERFHQELKLSRQVNHANVARVFHLEEAPGFVYYTMEYVEGQSLDKIILNSVFTMQEALPLLIQLAQGLEAIHQCGVVHRDIKPANAIVQSNGRAVIMDFGVAKKQDEETGITQAGATIGTPMYMAPEQLIGKKVDEKADLYAFGVLMYEVLTGVRPHDGNTCIALYMQKSEFQHEAPRKVNPKISRRLESLIQTLLQADPKNRIQSSKELISKLNRC